MNDLVVQSTELATDVGMTDEVSWTPSADMDLQTYLSIGKTFQQIQRSIAYWMGDWLCYGENRFGEAYSQALDESGKANETLVKWRAVAARVPKEIRRKELSWTHAFYTAYCTERLRGPLLDLAVNMNLSSRELKEITRLKDDLVDDLVNASKENISRESFLKLVNKFKLGDIERSPKDDEEGDDAQEEDKDDVPFSDLDDDDEEAPGEEVPSRSGLSSDDVLDFWENTGVALKFCGVSEAIWEGVAVRAGQDKTGKLVLIWEEIP